MKILDLLKRSLKKTLMHDCESCGMCSNDSVQVKWVTKESEKHRAADADDASADESKKN